MINMLKFKSGGAAHYQEYERAIEPLMRAVGGKPIFRLYDNVRTVINGGGVVSDWDAIYIGAYPSPAKFLEFSTSSAYKLAHKHRVALWIRPKCTPRVRDGLAPVHGLRHHNRTGTWIWPSRSAWREARPRSSSARSFLTVRSSWSSFRTTGSVL